MLRHTHTHSRLTSLIGQKCVVANVSTDFSEHIFRIVFKHLHGLERERERERERLSSRLGLGVSRVGRQL